MPSAILSPVKETTAISNTEKLYAGKTISPAKQPGYAEKKIVWLAIKFRLFLYACIILKEPKKILATYRAMVNLRRHLWGGDLKKLVKVNGKYYYNQYTPGWPSKTYNKLIKGELRRHADPLHIRENLSFIFFAITRKCPMRCEHCFEWDNLNKKESFTKETLKKVVDLYQLEGVLQFHFSGGEPMVRFQDLLELIRHTAPKSECWVLTSGFNLTTENARLLKKAGCKGIVVSIDHYIPDLHNIFRGHEKSYDAAITAVAAAREAGMVVSVSVCATKSFVEGGHLMPYLDFARQLGVHFVQMLEPRNVGHYEGKDVLLEEKHIRLLEDFFKKINHSAAYDDYPILMYHGYHQRRVGCFSGSRSVYIDSAGNVHACPFCHTSSYNIITWMAEKNDRLPQKENSCPQFGKIA